MFCIHSAALYLLLRELRPLTFSYINNQLHFYYFVAVIGGGVCVHTHVCFPSFDFASVRLFT